MHIVLSGSDTGYFSYLHDLVLSFRDNVRLKDVTFGIFDFGLTGIETTILKNFGCKVVKPEINQDILLKFDIPDRKKYAFVPLFAKKYFPEFTTYIWLDADTWCQNDEAIKLLIRGAELNGFAVITHTDRNYPNAISGGKVKVIRSIPLLRGRIYAISSYISNTIRRCYSAEFGNRLFFKHLLNAGVYALSHDAPHWAHWQASLREARFRNAKYISDQVPLNYAYYKYQLTAELLPSWCNWLCDRSTPAMDMDTGALVEPNLPHKEISILHFVNDSGRKPHRLISTDRQYAFETEITYSAYKAFKARMFGHSVGRAEQA